MQPGWIVAMLLAVVWAQSATAQTWQFRWEKGQILAYKVKHSTAVAEVVDGNKVESVSQLHLVKRWHVLDVDEQGIATLKLTLDAMRSEQKRPTGETLLFDSQDLDKSTPELREQMGKFVGQTLAVLRVDVQGRAVEVKQGSFERYQAEPPFTLLLPKAETQAGQSWVRPYTIAIEPPLGTGEKYEAQQKYHCSRLDDGKATIAVKTEFKTQPESAQERLPLLQKEVEGQVVFDLKAGRLQGVRFVIDRTVEQHQGPGSSYRFQSEYTEEFIPALTPVRIHGGIGP